jgi:sortase (surface protein transpeptidase)
MMVPIAAAGMQLMALRTSANTGLQLPTWNHPAGDGELQAGPLGITVAPDPGRTPIAIRIPDAGVDAEIERQQIVEGQMLDPTGPWIVSWYEQTARIGAIGNCVMAGHLDYWDIGPAVFSSLSELSEGALIDVIGRDRTAYTYAVTSVRRITIETLAVEELRGPDLVGHTDYPALTLITCGGDFNGEAYPDRDIVRAELVSMIPVDQDGSV